MFRPIAERKSELYGKPNEQFGAYQMGVQVSHCIYTEVSQEDSIQPIQGKPARHHTDAVKIQRVEIVEGKIMPDHVHLLVSIPLKMSVSSFMGYLKGKSALMMFDKHANLKYKFGNRHFWAEGYYVSTVGLNEATIKKYIEDQEKHDIAMDKLSVKEYEDPFKGKGK